MIKTFEDLMSMIVFCSFILVMLILIGQVIYDILNVSKPSTYSQYNKILDRLYHNLEVYCVTRGIPIYYGDEHFENNKDAAAFISYTATINYRDEIISSKDFKIYLRKQDLSCLAHEVGHYIGISFYYDRSEERADYEAKNLLMKNYLTKQELKNGYIEIYFDCMFSKSNDFKK